MSADQPQNRGPLLMLIYIMPMTKSYTSVPYEYQLAYGLC